jgi:hypothetical protein
MRLSWNEIRTRAKAFSQDWKDAHYEKGETQSFYNDFFNVFGVSRRKVAIFERKVELIDQNKRGFIDLLWPGVMLAEQKSAGKDLYKARQQAFDYIDGLKERDQPRYILTCDFQRFHLLDLETNQDVRFTLPELHTHVEAFAFIMGVQRRDFGTQADVNIKAAELMGTLHDALEKSGYTGHDLERLLVRLLFCLFADDTGIFNEKDDFLYLIDQRSAEDGRDVGRWLNDLFDVLDTPEDKRQSTLDPELAKFPYVNGALFSERLRTPAFDAKMRDDLITASRFDWGKVSPAIFGSLFQSVMEPAERRKKGAHYTTEANIQKVIGPLFLDDLKAELAKLKARKGGARMADLQEFQRKLARLRFLDPACGCGNFLVITYRELRLLELDCLQAMYPADKRELVLDVAQLSLITVDQFYGIELEEFPAYIAEVAMWMADHIANNDLGMTFGKAFARIPLKDSAHILHGDALERDWSTLLPPEKCSYILGNPPFIGAKYQSVTQRKQVRDIARLGGSGGTLDFVCAWFIKAGAYIAANTRIRIGFVATNSITQGEQVAQLWPILFDRHALEIAFAHRTFAWGSDARGKAHVHVVIIGLAHRTHEPTDKRLFSYADIDGAPSESAHAALTAYLFDAQAVANRHLVIEKVSSAINGATKLIIGSKPIDDGNYIFDEVEKVKFLELCPEGKKYLHPYVGSDEFINGFTRWILALQQASPNNLRTSFELMRRVSAVRAFRLKSKSKPTQAIAETPTLYHVNVIPNKPFVLIPRVSSERRAYVPIGWVSPPTIPSDATLCLLEADVWCFSILTSRMHMAWLAHIGGRLKSDFRYSIGLVYNTFPWPVASAQQKTKIETLAQAVLDARARYTTSSLADLYDPDTMPADLRKAHQALDVAVDKLYRSAPFDSDRDRVEHLFGLYEKLVNPLGQLAAAKPKKRAKKAAQPAK